MSKYRIYLAGVAEPFTVESDDDELSFAGNMMEFAHFGSLSVRVAAVVAVEKLSDESAPGVGPIPIP